MSEFTAKKAINPGTTPFVAKMPECLRDTSPKAAASKPANTAPARVLRSDVVGVLIRSGEPMTRNEIAEKLGVAGAAINTHLGNLVYLGSVARVEFGRYAIKRRDEIDREIIKRGC